MTLEDIEKIPKELLLASDIAEYLSADPDTIRRQARNEPEKLGFPVIVAGKMVRIPKEGFVYYCRYGRPCIDVKLRPETVKYHMDHAIKEMFSHVDSASRTVGTK